MRYPVLIAALIAALPMVSGCSSGSDQSATLVLDNPTWDRVNVEAVITKSEDCGERANGYVATKDFVMTKGQTHKVVAPNAETICWRHDRDPNNPVAGDWSEWSRATLFPGQTTETDL
jgi:hypothetical protein